MNKEGPYVTSSIDSLFDIVESKKNKVLFCVKATVTSVISKDNFGNPWTLELVINSCSFVSSFTFYQFDRIPKNLS